MANEDLRTSTEGLVALRIREGVVQRYYNDLANNCTFGIGTLVHWGPCSVEELSRPVTAHEIDMQLQIAVRNAEAAVKRQVSDVELTQAQFDALVSFTYNVGPTGAQRALEAANMSDRDAVVQHMSESVFIRPRDAEGRRMAPALVPGLVHRRMEETQPFRRDRP